uniref:Uncharacterized protein n=1 Tax=Heterorhabditis bacteriophora TaxID=37862 RepID=A0A1I7WKJ3_HETBA
MVLEEECEKDDELGSSKQDEADSGLSGVEGGQQLDTGRRDACCSPVRHFPAAQSSRTSGGRSKMQQRRHAGTASGQLMGSRKHSSGISVHDVPSISSDSEADGGERLFMPSRRQRTSSIEYDGEPEPSDTDVAN